MELLEHHEPTPPRAHTGASHCGSGACRRGRYRYAVRVMSATGQSRLSEEQVVVVE